MTEGAAQFETDSFHRPLIREPVAIRQQQHLGPQARGDRRKAVTLRVTLGEIRDRACARVLALERPDRVSTNSIRDVSRP